jgi:mRNA-degrading endonuclease toxin of MazEF toxin-antitoxin module
LKKGEIWIASLEPKTGSDVGKQRPVVIAQTDLLNDVNHPTVLVLPVSSQTQQENPLRLRIEHACFEKKYGYILIRTFPENLGDFLPRSPLDVNLRRFMSLGRLLA